jgi:hypothetical protein
MQASLISADWKTHQFGEAVASEQLIATCKLLKA